MTQMTALKSFKFAGRMLAVSEEFSVKGKSEARLLKAMKLATEAPEKKVPAIFKKVEVEEDKPKRKYMRRDMAAE